MRHVQMRLARLVFLVPPHAPTHLFFVQETQRFRDLMQLYKEVKRVVDL